MYNDLLDEPQDEEMPKSPKIKRSKVCSTSIGLKNKILKYYKLFPNYLENIEHKLQIDYLENSNKEELQKILEEVQITVNSRNSSSMIPTLYFSASGILEKAAPVVGVNIDGLTAALSQNEEIINTLNELSLKYEQQIIVSPELRLAYQTSNIVLQLYTLNRNSKTIDNHLDKKIPEELIENYKDL